MTSPNAKRQPIPFGRYLLLDRINIGGMAEVWRGKQFGAAGFERLVAIKRILPNIAEDDEFISMFKDEAKISVQLTHANIGQVYELGQITNTYYIAMEYISGRDMRALFDRCRKKGEPSPVPLVCYCISKVCEGLDYAHRKKDGMGRDLNIVHRDISPQNILISYEGEVKVIDFGIAKAAGKATKTQAGILKGKFGYMSPEQIRGLPLDRRSDIFAIGVCLYEMLTGERLFVGDSDFSVLEKVRKADVVPPSTYNKRIPDALEKIVLRALARDVDERYQYANELGDDLQRFLLTSDSIFSRKDLMQYMKSTFAEDVEREKQRLMEYAEVKPPEGMLVALEYGSAQQPPQRGPAPVEPTPASKTPHRPTASGLPVLTAATPPPPQQDEEAGATVMVEAPANESFDENGEPVTQPGLAAPKPALPPPPPAPVRPPPPAMAPMSVPSMRVPAVAAAGLANGSQDRLPRIVREQPPPDMLMSRPVPQSTGVPMRPPPQPVREVSRPPPPPPPPPDFREENTDRRQLAGGRLPLLLGGGGLALALIIAVALLLLRPDPAPPMGFLYLDVPAELRGKVQVNLGGQDLGVPQQWPLLRQVRAGSVAVLVSAEGYEPFTQMVQVAAEQPSPPMVNAVLKPVARNQRMVFLTEPEDAALKLDGKVVRQQGSREAFIMELPPGKEVLVEASAPGFKPLSRRVPVGEGKPTTVQLSLEPALLKIRLESEPSNAPVFVEDKQQGTTPANLELPASVKQVTLRLKCYEEAVVELKPESAGTLPKVTLNKQKNCRP